MFSSRKTIFFADCDPAQVLYFANIFRLAHEVYEEWLLNNNLFQLIFHNNFIFPINSSSATYRGPLTHGSNVTVQLACTVLRDHSFQLTYRFLSAANNLLAQVETVHICLEKDNQQKAILPEQLQTMLKEIQNKTT